MCTEGLTHVAALLLRPSVWLTESHKVLDVYRARRLLSITEIAGWSAITKPAIGRQGRGEHLKMAAQSVKRVPRPTHRSDSNPRVEPGVA